MQENNKFFRLMVREYLVLGNNKEARESAFHELLSRFLCPKNSGVEQFLKKNAIEFAKKN